jgi:DNA ligase (NAD+)
MKNTVIYLAENGSIEFKKDLNDKHVVWANLNQIAQLFECDKSVISRHINNIFKSNDLDKEMGVANFATTTKHSLFLLNNKN